MRNRASIFPGLFLVGVGLFLLLDRLDIYLVPWDLLIPFFAFLFGTHLLVRAAKFKPRRHVFTGTLFAVLGAFYFFWNYGTFEDYFYFGSYAPVFPVAIGLAFLMLFLYDYHRWWALFPAVLFAVPGIIALLIFMRVLDPYILEECLYFMQDNFQRPDVIVIRVRNFLPAVLVILGLILIVSSFRKVGKSS